MVSCPWICPGPKLTQSQDTGTQRQRLLAQTQPQFLAPRHNGHRDPRITRANVSAYQASPRLASTPASRLAVCQFSTYWTQIKHNQYIMDIFLSYIEYLVLGPPFNALICKLA